MAVLIIAGLDTGGGAGIAADIKTVSALGLHPLPILSAVTYQNPDGVRGYHVLPPELIRGEIRAVKDFFEIEAVKIGMLGNGEAVKIVAEETEGLLRVLDPVLTSSTDHPLIDVEGIETLKDLLIPGSIVTPNVPEAEKLTGMKVSSVEDMKKAARILVEEFGAKAAVVKGGHLDYTDVLYWNGEFYEFRGEMIEGFTHGTGCAFSSALASLLAKGMELPEAVEEAKRFVETAIRFSSREGKCINPLAPLEIDVERWRAYSGLKNAVKRLVEMGELLNPFVPEVGTNFAYATPQGEVFAVKGRIVRYGKTIKPVGPVELNASDHLKRALLKFREFYPEVRAVINLRYSRELIERAEKLGLTVSFYDRREEPEDVKTREGGTIPWGIETAIRRVRERPDVIYHLGDWGKEPMVLIFGENPLEVIEKVKELLDVPRGQS
ncbi:bifunctional hydroxymethylpyrimidine kinase/phosphomethylpyrimidine kinase [Thermococcus sp. CX2]|uniref:bifunctional hydroxymethylpyrimidine kinase/phosphomethylpyrimidine kinase n=1 Tax=Thermococcus sp. CX2 TaxID=163006 RepID=UPI00143B542F|nr:bifunctional hydroxymethylpyrimidine kinase/phosphomethylpyrimidine kinase [Thermococcus sp. CX2]NJE84468.1 bifunctional hydroxymethylpyrimidine kinase/phosphomethylpyrimidine kinase [Thermococcus sp. CX2]